MMKVENREIEISIIMPVYNSGIYLKAAVESILKQSFKKFELILVDDGSTDGSSERCDEYAVLDKRVVVIHKKNGGICNARNSALKIVRGKYIGFSDHDDEYLPGLLENAYKRAISTNADIVKFCKKEFVMNKGVIVKERSNTLLDTIWEKENIKANYLDLFCKYKINCMWDGLYKRELFETNDIHFDEFYKYGGEDFDITARLLPFVERLALMNECYYVHYVRSGFSTSSKYKSYKLKHMTRLTQTIYDSGTKIGYDFTERKDDYNYFLIEFYINTIASLLENKDCNYDYKKKKQILYDCFKSDFISCDSKSSSVVKFINKSFKIGFSYFLYKNNLIKGLLLLHRLRNIQMNFFVFKYR